MQKSAGHKKLELIFRTEFYGYMLSEGSGFGPGIHSHVQYLALQYPYQFGLGMFASLGMQAPDDTIGGKGLVVLYKSGGGAGFFPEFCFIKTLKKITPSIFKNLQFDNKASFKRGFC